jgi:beta-glucosidase
VTETRRRPNPGAREGSFGVVRRDLLGLGMALLLPLCSPAQAAPEDPDSRAAATEAQMTDAERFQLLHGSLPILEGRKATAGFVPGIPRLGVPDLWETDASLGVANPFMLRKGDVATAMPSGLAIAASFDPDIAFAGGAIIGAEARSKGFNVLLGGGVNLARDASNGRNFEYLGEDPLLAGTLAGEAIRGVQSQGVISTVKHFSLNAQETLRNWADARIDEGAHRESDLLAFEIAIGRGKPGAVMCAYNLVNGAYACGADHLLNGVLKHDWGYRGWVMSDWGAVHAVSYFNAGLDQQSAAQTDKAVWFGDPLNAEMVAGRVPRERVYDAVRRILRSIYAVGADHPVSETPIDYAAHAKGARRAAIEGIVLLKNDGLLPLAAGARSILVVGGHADIGVMSGGGSSQVIPVGGPATMIPVGASGAFESMVNRQLIVPSSPLKALRAALPLARIDYDGGYFPETAAARAAKADLVIVFATRWQVEGMDAPGLALPEGQDGLIATLAQANAHTIVVLETGNPVIMPWLARVGAVVEAWYPGQAGGEAIADILTGKANPSGRLPITFPASIVQTPRPLVAGLGLPDETRITVTYSEGSDVGYRGFARRGQTPLFPFGHGLSYTRFDHGLLTLQGGANVTARFSVTNAGATAGVDTPQLYLVNAAGRPVLRLAAFGKVALGAGEHREVSLTVDPRLLADWTSEGWRIRAGTYSFALGKSAGDLGSPASLRLFERRLEP